MRMSCDIGNPFLMDGAVGTIIAGYSAAPQPIRWLLTE